ncbi:10630_t:CDS:2, partial [Cetraspora pellucida]
QHVRILIRNKLDEPTSIHWHGLHMKNTTYSDGVPTLTQCPIQKGKNFIHDFYANEKPGTHWYHSHYKSQRVDGLYGYIIIKEDKENDENYDVDLIDNNCMYCAHISDWYHCRAGVLLNYYHYCYVTTRLTPEPVPHSILFNGIGGANEVNGDNCNNRAVNGSVETNYVYNFERGKKYRLRILNAGTLALYYFSIDHHMLQVIEVEGTRVNSTDQFKHLPINVGQRYSVIATTNNITTNNFWMRFQTSLDCLRLDTTSVDQIKLLVKEIKAIVRYDKSEGRPNTTPWTKENEILHCMDLNYTLLLPANGSLKAPKLEINQKTNKSKTCHESTGCEEFAFEISMTTINATTNPNNNYATFGSISLGSSFGSFSGETFGYTENTLHYSMEYQEQFEQYGSSIYPDPALNIIILDKTSDIIDVIITCSDTIAHSFHLHGHSFWVMEYSYNCSVYNNCQGSRNIVTLTFDHPIARDTITVPRDGGESSFSSGNIGVWAFHCHIEWHLGVGMLAQFVEHPSNFSSLRKASNETKLIDKACNP